MLLERRRLYFFGIHFAISLTILLVLIYQILYVWYPHGLFYTSGGWYGTKIVFFVDMVLGPVLTFILSSPTKQSNELIRDLCLCAFIQVSAMSYGISLILETKPVALSIYDGSIHVVQNYQIANLPDKAPFMSSSHLPLLYSDDINRYDLSKPEFKEKAQSILKAGRDYGVPPHAAPQTFDEIKNRQAELKSITAQSLAEIDKNPEYDDSQLKSVMNPEWFVVSIDGSFKKAFIAFDINGNIKKSICCHGE